MYEEFPETSKNTQELPKVSKNSKKLPKNPKNSRKIHNLTEIQKKLIFHSKPWLAVVYVKNKVSFLPLFNELNFSFRLPYCDRFGSYNEFHSPASSAILSRYNATQILACVVYLPAAGNSTY